MQTRRCRPGDPAPLDLEASEARAAELEALQTRLGYRFVTARLLDEATTHSSWANERGGGPPHNERLEFLGDAALGLMVAQELYERFPHVREGELTRMRSRLVSRAALTEVGRELRLERCLLLGKGEEEQGGRERASVLTNAVEAVIGAVFLDAGFEAARLWLREAFRDRWPAAVVEKKPKDFKSRLQELTQRRNGALPSYELVGANGPPHAQEFSVALHLPDGRRVLATGPSLKRAEQAAASKGLELLEDPAE